MDSFSAGQLVIKEMFKLVGERHINESKGNSEG